MAIGTFLALIVWHFETIDSPPTRDQAVGHWMEADFLAETHFDYATLLDQEGEPLGGPRLYLFSLIPSFIAAVMLLTGSAKATIVIYHLFTYACASVISLLMFVMVRPFAGALGALLVCAAMLTTPMFSAQISLCGMDIPMAAGCLLAAYCVFRQYFVLAAVCSLLAFFAKMSGILITPAILISLVVRLPWPSAAGCALLTRKQVFRGILVNGAVLALQVFLFELALYLTRR